MEYNMAVAFPTVDLPCGVHMQLPIAQIAEMRAAGIEQLHITQCYNCKGEHTVTWPEGLNTVEITFRPTSETVLVPGASPNGGAGWKPSFSG